MIPIGILCNQSLFRFLTDERVSRNAQIDFSGSPGYLVDMQNGLDLLIAVSVNNVSLARVDLPEAPSSSLIFDLNSLLSMKGKIPPTQNPTQNHPQTLH
jgi:hypothetical protein